ncbi:MAG TPA: thioredoxin domain-containing protein [Actinomycetes bacterium]|nr:thioredoxin domain-containing protein [Actinomycetes bacterium]
MTDQPAPNRLVDETSPYLLQHAHNPVDWYPWGPEALERARAEDKPILLSIGYAACHWCHVMAHESFEDAETAALMNEHFVCVKVDREERPDLDGIYMDAVQAMTGQGGWPMTVFLTPDGGPFYAGTYYPKVDRPGMPSFRRVLAAVADAWANRRDDVRRQGDQVVKVLAEQAGALAGDGGGQLAEDTLRQAFAGLQGAFDREWGGFGRAPKFPQPMTLEFLLRCHLRGFPGALDMVRLTLDRMAAGGIFDQVGGGFHRYSTDGRWLVPHFEKMLYDNALLLRLYTHAWQVTGEDRYRRTAERTAGYLLDELRHPSGGFFSSQDADSEGVEGRFFVWSWEELAGIAGEPVARYLGATPEGNWEGANVLWTPRPAEAVAEASGLTTDELQAQVAAALPRLLEARAARVHPATDDKVLAAWNGLAITALAEAGRSFGEPRYLEAAMAAAEFVLGALRDERGRLLRAWREGRKGGPGYLDDHACMADACLTLYETTFELRWLREARRLAAAMVELFADPDGDGFYQTGEDAEQLVVRPRELFDNAVPAGSSVAADVLQRLGRLTGDQDWERAGLGALRPVLGVLGRAPTGFGHALGAADFALARVREVAIVGRPGATDTDALLAKVWGTYQPNRVLAAAAPDDRAAQQEIPLLADRLTLGGRATAYVCEHFVCQRPVTEPAELAAQLA